MDAFGAHTSRSNISLSAGGRRATYLQTVVFMYQQRMDRSVQVKKKVPGPVIRHGFEMSRVLETDGLIFLCLYLEEVNHYRIYGGRLAEHPEHGRRDISPCE